MSDVKDAPDAAKLKDGLPGSRDTGTWRTCSWSIDNETSNELAFVTVAHTAGTSIDQMLWQNLPTGKSNITMTINFKTGIGFDNDYWYIMYSFAGGDNKSRLFTGGGKLDAMLMCDLYSSDEQGTGYIRFNGDRSVECVPPKSSNDPFTTVNRTA